MEAPVKAPALQHREVSRPVYGEFALSAMLEEFDRLMQPVTAWLDEQEQHGGSSG